MHGTSLQLRAHADNMQTDCSIAEYDVPNPAADTPERDVQADPAPSVPRPRGSSNTEPSASSSRDANTVTLTFHDQKGSHYQSYLNVLVVGSLDVG